MKTETLNHIQHTIGWLIIIAALILTTFIFSTAKTDDFKKAFEQTIAELKQSLL